MHQASHPCPCQNLTQQFGSVITRHCGGSYSHGAEWKAMDYSQCGFTERIIEALQVRKPKKLIKKIFLLLQPKLIITQTCLKQKPPRVLAKVLLNVTSSPDTLVASEVSVAAVVIDELTTTAAMDPEVSQLPFRQERMIQ